MDHARAAEIIQLRERLGLMVALLVRGREERIGIGDDIVLQLAHRLESQARGLVEGILGPHQGHVWGAVERLAVLREETAQEAQGRNLIERVHERGPVARNDVQVAVSGLDEGREQAGSVHAFAFGKDRLHVREIVHGEIQCLHAPVLGGIHEIHHPDPFLPDELDHIGAGEFLRQLAQEGNHLVGVQFDAMVHYYLCGLFYTKIMNHY